MFKFFTKAILTAVVAGGLFGGVARADTVVAPEPPSKKQYTPPSQWDSKKPVQVTTVSQWDSKKPVQVMPPSQWDSKKPMPVTPTQQGQQQQYTKPDSKPMPPVVPP